MRRVSYCIITHTTLKGMPSGYVSTLQSVTRLPPLLAGTRTGDPEGSVVWG